MLKYMIILVMLLAQCLYGAAKSTVASGEWSSGAVWNGGTIPVNGDSITITAGHTITVNSNYSDRTFAGMTLAGVVQGATTASGYLKFNNDIILANFPPGNFMCGSSSVPLPADRSFTIDFANSAKGFVSDKISVNLYCWEPDPKYCKLSSAYSSGTSLAVDTDVRQWLEVAASGLPLYIAISESKGGSAGCTLVEATAIAEATITIANAIDAKSAGDVVCLVTRNIRAINSTASPFAIVAGWSTIESEIRATTGISSPTLVFSGGCVYGASIGRQNFVDLSTSSSIIVGCGTGIETGTAPTTDSMLELGGSILGCNTGVSNLKIFDHSGFIFGCTSGIKAGNLSLISGQVNNCVTGIEYLSSSMITGSVSNCTTGIYACDGLTFHEATLANTTDVKDSSFVANKTVFGGTTEASNSGLSHSSYSISFDHDNVTGAIKTFTSGGMAASDSLVPSPLFPRSYKHTTITGGPNFRQVSHCVAAGEELEIRGYFKFSDNLSSYAPRLEVIDPLSDPFVFDTSLPLASGLAPIPAGSSGWQIVDVRWENTGNEAKEVYIRLVTWAGTNKIIYEVLEFPDDEQTLIGNTSLITN
jgi:hypothetical protein